MAKSPSFHCVSFRLLLPYTLAVLLLFAPLAFADGDTTPILDGVFTVENDGQAIWKGVSIKTIEHNARSSGYVVSGLIRYDIEGRGIALLQIRSTPKDNRSGWSIYDFAMTRKIFGTSQQNYGTDDFQPFRLYIHRGSGKPETILTSISVWLHGKGTVELADLRVDDVFHATGEWFDGRTAGFIGGFLGSGIGLFGGLLGCLAGFLVPRGKGRRLITCLLWFALILGAVLLILGLTAVCLGQPYHVWYLFVHPGMMLFILTPIFLLLLPYIYAQSELRKMQALDV